MTLEIYIVPLHYRIDICNNSVVDIYLYLLRNRETKKIKYLEFRFFSCVYIFCLVLVEEQWCIVQGGLVWLTILNILSC